LDDLKDSSASAVLWERLFQKEEGYLAPLGADERGYCAEHVLAVAALFDSPGLKPSPPRSIMLMKNGSVR